MHDSSADPLGLDRLRLLLRMSARLAADLDRLRADGAALEAQTRHLVAELDEVHERSKERD